MSRLFDALVVIGALSLAVGLWMVAPALCLIVMGALLIIGGILGAWLSVRVPPRSQ